MIHRPVPPEALVRPISLDIGRWTPPMETQLLAWLSTQAPAGDILEIGCNNGLTTREFALSNPDRTVYAVDFVEVHNTMVAEQQYELPTQEFGKWCSNLPNVRLFNENSRTWDYTRAPFSFVFIDGDHSYEGVKADTERALAHLPSGSVIVWHDYEASHPEWCQVKRYIDTEMVPRFGDALVHYIDTWSVALTLP